MTSTASPRSWNFAGRVRRLGETPWVMGIVNVTPDSFSDGGHYLEAERAVDRGMQLVADGADLLDIGGESSRPGADHVTEDEELARQLNDLLSERLSTFVYFDRQKELAGTDGEATFNRVFGQEARIVAVLHRTKWGTNRRISKPGNRPACRAKNRCSVAWP